MTVEKHVLEDDEVAGIIQQRAFQNLQTLLQKMQICDLLRPRNGKVSIVIETMIGATLLQ